MTAPAIVRVDASNRALLDDIVDDELFDGALDAANIDAFIDSDERALFVAVAGGAAVAQCTVFMLRHVDRDADLYVDELATRPEQQRRGIASALLSAAGAWGASRGCRTLWVAADADNDPALALYEGLGGLRKPAVVFDLSLPERPDA